MTKQIATWCLMGLLGSGPAFALPPSPTYAFVNGRWWNGSEFIARTMYSAGGLLHSSWASRLDQTIDLHDRFVIPPLTEGHNHWLEPQKVDAYNACYLADGVYYLRDMGNAPWIVNQLRDKMNLPTSVDFVTALQGFTGPAAHPIEIIDYFVKAGIFPKTWKSPYDPQAEFVVRTEHDVNRGFDLLLKENPSYVKSFLLFSEEYEKRLNDPAKYGNHRGMDPKLLPHLVQRAHAAKLKVMAHVYSVPDFRTAILAGVDEIVHLPGFAYDEHLSMNHFQLTAADAELARHHGVPVTTTLYGVADLLDEDPKHAKLIRDEIVVHNLKILKAHQVRILIGSDHFRYSPLSEILTLRDLGVFSNAELINMDTDTTARAVFPDRKIGRLDDGYEANFLALDKNPVQNLDNLRSISLRVKQGHRLTLPPSALNRKSLDCIGEAQ